MHFLEKLVKSNKLLLKKELKKFSTDNFMKYEMKTNPSKIILEIM